jgi:sulfoxide reductase heme-binding subunit YedZ
VQRWQLGLIKAIVWIACLAPFGLLTAGAFELGYSLGADPVAEVLDTLGKTGLNLLMITLALTPARLLSGLNFLARLRRLLGLFSFFYIAMHFVAFAWLDLQFAWGTIAGEIVLRPFITIGMIALVLLIPLAVTSTRGMQRRLGRRWVSLHRLVYPIGILGVWHYWWQVKADTREALVYIGILAALLGYRLFKSWQRKQRRARAGTPAPS